ncbi:MAG: bifunctional methylenetetrahydrofolate dehydrogenase/methenyltetrahydrofolate cyclohydrolase FolD [Planctomycetota bacterium]|nr:MAG: bifunctional methylenetetrahydrofolate dehydrogenase/methenyltetrahydrofolate cyclohydrolase FolD [Planctomycetota bacterium]
MSARILDGKALAARIRAGIRDEVAAGVAAGRPRPGLATVLVGDDPASHIYVRNKRRACEEVGFTNFHFELPAATERAELLARIAELNRDPAVHGILVQLPLPAAIDEQEVLLAVDPAKDADGFHPRNQGALLQGAAGLRPCTPRGVMALIDETGIELRGRRAVVVGRSNIVGKPVALMLLERHATVTICHSRTADLAAEVAAADVVVAAVGVAKLIQGDWIRPGAVVIDVGMNRDEAGRLCGDVDYAAAAERAGWITPVPGGVGPMTIAMLLRNTLDAAWSGYQP